MKGEIPERINKKPSADLNFMTILSFLDNTSKKKSNFFYIFFINEWLYPQ